ncbi:MAG TPA: ParB/RepB/Spo0J family partition protein [Pyrinomonadaceae bacterium]|nr:ParB/RepB/Spo0J family partition protein [Pyrinomonadaceae bacterium]
MKQTYEEIPLNSIITIENYRKTFNDKSLDELAKSILANGVVEPILVRRNGVGFDLIAGERRVRGSLIAGMVKIPAIIKENVSDGDFLKIQLLENIQRENVPYMEEARGLRRLRAECDLDISEMSKILGKSDATIYNLLLLTKMSKEAQDAANKGELGKMVAVRIARLPNHDLQDQAAKDLRRKNRDKLVSDRFARNYFQENFGERQVRMPKKTKIQKSFGNDYQANWKKYLVRFSVEQFEYFKSIVKGRTETGVLAEAVEVVMRGESNGNS